MLSNTPRKPQASVADVLFVIEGLHPGSQSRGRVKPGGSLVCQPCLVSSRNNDINLPPPPIELRHPRLKDFNTPFITRPIDNCLLISDDL